NQNPLRERGIELLQKGLVANRVQFRNSRRKDLVHRLKSDWHKRDQCACYHIYSHLSGAEKISERDLVGLRKHKLQRGGCKGRCGKGKSFLFSCERSY